MNNSNYDENNDVNMSPIQESNINEPVINNNNDVKTEEDILENNMIMTSLNGRQLDDFDQENMFQQNIPEEYIQNNSEITNMDSFDISPEPINNAINNYNNLENELINNDDIEKTISITPFEQRLLKEFINDLSEDDEEISKEDLNEEIDLLENPSIDNDRLKFFVNQLSNEDNFNYEKGLEKLASFSDMRFSIPLSMSLNPDPSSDFVNLKPNEKAKEEKKEMDSKSKNPSKDEIERRIDLEKRAKEIDKKPELKQHQGQNQQQNVRESILSTGIKMLQNKNKRKSNEIEDENSEELNSGDKIDGLTDDIKTLTKNFQSYNLMDDNDPNKQVMKSYIEKKISEMGDKMDNNPISDKDLESDPKKSQSLEKSTSRLNKNMKKTKNSDMDGLKDFKERMSNFFNQVKKVVSYIMSKIKGNESTISP